MDNLQANGYHELPMASLYKRDGLLRHLVTTAKLFQPRRTSFPAMASQNQVTHGVSSMNDEAPNTGVTSGSQSSDAHESLSQRKGASGDLEKTGFEEAVTGQNELRPSNTYDIESGEEVIDHAANKDDILTHTIHVDDDPTLNALTFRTFFLGE